VKLFLRRLFFMAEGWFMDMNRAKAPAPQPSQGLNRLVVFRGWNIFLRLGTIQGSSTFPRRDAIVGAV